MIETKAAREAGEKAERERLSFVERFIKKRLPSHLNSIVIFVNNQLLSVRFCFVNQSFFLGCSWYWLYDL